MKYNIDRVETISEDERLLKIQGWMISECYEMESIEITTGECYRLVRTEREDVNTAFGITNKKYKYGFEIIAEYPRNDLYYHITFKSVEKMICEQMNLTDYLPKNKRKKRTIRKNKTELEILKAFKEEAVHYNIEKISWNADKDCILITGWAFAKSTGKSSICVNGNNEVIRCTRKDVLSYYRDKGIEVNEICGFIIYVKESADGIHIVFEDEQDAVSVYLNQRCLKDATDDITKFSIMEDIFSTMKKKKYLSMYGSNGVLYKKIEQKIKLEEEGLNRSTYKYESKSIPLSWVKLQKKQPQIHIIIAVKETEKRSEYIDILTECLSRQKYQNFKVLFIGSEKDIHALQIKNVINYSVMKSTSIEKMKLYQEAVMAVNAPYFLFMNQEDYVEEDFLAAFIEQLNRNTDRRILFADYDIDFKGELIFPIYRKGNYCNENTEFKLIAALFSKEAFSTAGNLEELCRVDEKEILNIDRIYYHYRLVEDIFENRAKSKPIAFYLPQFHENEENNKWWGKGFTEWTNVKRGVPMFRGHNQPRVPERLGYYDLVEDRKIQYKQVELAKKFGVYGFCFYYYWFNGKRLLEKPFDQFVENKDLRFPFCICWANETWSRRWNGDEKEILIKQVHNASSDSRFIKSILPLFKDERYIKVDEKPLLLIYRIDLFPKPAYTIDFWRKYCRREGIGEIHVALVQSFGMVDHRIYGADSSVEFPPHKIWANERNGEINQKTEGYEGKVYSYKEVVDNQMIVKKREYTLFPGSMLEWDNTARRMKSANVFYKYHPELFGKWLIKNQMYTRIYNKEPIMFINAWNEWAEGSYLEPDQKYGTQALEMVKKIIALR